MYHPVTKFAAENAASVSTGNKVEDRRQYHNISIFERINAWAKIFPKIKIGKFLYLL